MTFDSSKPRTEVVHRLFNPKSIAIIGMSARPGSTGQSAIHNLSVNDYPAELYLVGRSGGEIDGRKILTSVEELPEGVDLGIVTLPAAGIPETLEAGARRKLGTAAVFASGFGEAGEEGKVLEHKVSSLLDASGIGMIGPNTFGFANMLNGLAVRLFPAPAMPRVESKPRSAAAVLGQSGGLVGVIFQTLEAHGLPVAYNAATGNELGLDLCDFLSFFLEDEVVNSVIVYAEHIKRPKLFIELARRARALDKAIVMMHPGRSTRGAAAFQSHTGALAGDYALMRTVLAAEGVITVDSIDALTDAAELVIRYPKLPTKGVGLVTFSGALCGVAHDLAEDIAIDYPEPTPETLVKLQERLPEFVDAKNPADLTTVPLADPGLLGFSIRAFLDDPNIGSVGISIPVARHGHRYMEHVEPILTNNDKPVALTQLGSGDPLPADVERRMRDANVAVFYSTERMLRAFSVITEHGKTAAMAAGREAALPFAQLPDLGKGAIAEWAGKAVLNAIGVSTPGGRLTTALEDAITVGEEIGFPLVMKAQSAKLTHKTEAGGVIVGVKDREALVQAWHALHDNIARHAPGLVLDGVLVEAMAPKGVEMMLGARRDAQWGAVLLIGLGGIWVEALGDVRLVPADASKQWLREAIMSLKTSKLLTGFRGAPAADIEAMVDSAHRLGRLMQTRPEIVEIDINPLVVHAAGQGVTALDALIVTQD